jgi:hypothetical protein
LTQAHSGLNYQYFTNDVQQHHQPSSQGGESSSNSISILKKINTARSGQSGSTATKAKDRYYSTNNHMPTADAKLLRPITNTQVLEPFEEDEDIR